MHRSLLVGAVLALATLSSASADDGPWKGPGWYLTDLGVAIVTGPYDNEAQCNADRAQRNDADLACEYLDKDPMG